MEAVEVVELVEVMNGMDMETMQGLHKSYAFHLLVGPKPA